MEEQLISKYRKRNVFMTMHETLLLGAKYLRRPGALRRISE